MESLIQVALDELAVEPNGLQHPGSSRLGRGEQRFNKPARLLRVEANDVPPGDDFLGRLPRMRDNKSRHRTPFERGGLLENAFVAARDTGDEPLRFLLCRIHWCRINVCRCGTHRKD
jgi:hypothetical protein